MAVNIDELINENLFVHDCMYIERKSTRYFAMKFFHIRILIGCTEES